MHIAPFCRAVVLSVFAGVGLAFTTSTEANGAFPPPSPTGPIAPPYVDPTWPGYPPLPIIPPNQQPWTVKFTRGCTVAQKSYVWGIIDGGLWIPVPQGGSSYNQCRPYYAQTTPPRTPAGVYSGEPALPPSPPPIPSEAPITQPPGADLNGDGVPDQSPMTTEEFQAAVALACDHARGGGVQWGSVGDKLVINGIGGGGDAQLAPGEIAGPSALNGDSVLVASGYKVSDSVDLVVQLPGTDFVLTRNFTGEKDWPLGGENLNSAGSGWTMSFDAAVQTDLQPVSYGPNSSTDRREWQQASRWVDPATSLPGDGFETMGTAVVAVSPIRDSVMFTNYRWYRSDNGGDPPAMTGTRSRDVREFLPIGPRMQRLEAGFWTVGTGSSAVKRPAWILKDPGGGTSVFFRPLITGETTPTGWTITPKPRDAVPACSAAAGLVDFPDGALWQQIDPAGHAWTYHYSIPSLNGCVRAKLTSIVLHGVDETDSGVKAVIDVQWYENEDTSGVTGDVVGSGGLRQVSVRRPFSTSETGWFYTDAVYYDYVGTTKWFRNGSHVYSRLPSDLSPSADLGQRDDNLIQVIHYTALNQPSYSSTTGGLARPSSVQWHTAITQYRYIHVGTSETTIDQKNRQIKMTISPGQIEHIARLAPGLGDHVLETWDSATTSRPSARLEAVAEALLTLDDNAVLVAGTPNRTLLNFADHYTAYYTDPNPDYREFFGRVKSEYSRPGEFGHTRLVNYGYDRPEECPYDVVLGDTLRATKMYIGDSTSTETDTFPFLLFGRVEREWEYSSNSDALGGTSANPWKLKRVTRHRSEDRLLQAAAFCNGYGPDGDIGYMSVRHLVISTPVTVRTSVEEVTDTAPYEDTDTTNDNGLPDGRMWLDETFFDYSLRATQSYPMGSIAISQPTSSLSAGQRWLVDRLHTQEITGRGAGASGATGTAYVESTPLSSPTTGMSAALYAANAQVTSRSQQSYVTSPTGGATGSSWQAVSQKSYLTGWAAGTVMADSARPDLVVTSERFAQPAAVLSAPSANSVETTQTNYTFTTAATSSAAIVDTATAKVERELTTEFGDGGSGTLDTTYHFTDGLISEVDRPDTSKTLYEHHFLHGQTTKVTVSTGGSSPSTLESTAIYDLSGHQLGVKTANGDAAAYMYTLAKPPAVQLSSPTSSGAAVGSLPPELGGDALASTYVPVLCTIQWPRKIESGKATGPARIDWLSIDQNVLRSSTYTLTSTGADLFDGSAPLAASTSLTNGCLDKEASRRIGVFTPSGAAFRSYSWPFTPDLLPTGKSEEAYATSVIFNGDGDSIKATDALGNISQPEFDGPGRTVKSKVGITTASPVSRTIFDGESTSADDQVGTKGIGPSRVTLTIGLPDGRDFVSGDPTRGKRTWYDQRGRPIITCAVSVVSDASNVITYVPVGPYAVTWYDNVDRPICSFVVANDSSVNIGDVKTLSDPSITTISTLLASSKVSSIKRTEYSQRGLVFRESSYVSPLTSPTPPSGMGDLWMVSRHLFDVLGRPVVSTAAGQPVVKTEYDLLGRIKHTETTAEDYSDLTHLRTYGYGRVLETTTNDYIDGTTLVKRVTKTVRGHDNDTGTGTSGSNMGSAVKTYAETVYDAAGRATGTLNYGTNNTSGDVFSNGSSPSEPSSYQATVSTGRISLNAFTGAMRAETFYDARGLASSSTTWLTDSPSPITRTNKQLYDSLGRSYASIENSSGSTLPAIEWDGTSTKLRWKVTSWPSGSAPDQDRVTSTVFDAASHQLKRTAHIRNSSGVDAPQTTAYRYTWTSADSPGSGVMNSLLPLHGSHYQTSFPDNSTGEPSTAAADQIYFSYNAVGEQTATTDQRGVIHESVRDGAGRTVADRASNFPTLTIPGAPSSVTITGVSGTWSLPSFAVDNRVQQISTRYDRFGRVAAVYSHSAAVDYSEVISGTPVDKGLVASGETESALDGSSVPNSILNYVRYQYDRAGDMIRIRQSVDGIDSTGLSGLPAKPGAQQLRTYFGYTVASSGLTFTAASGGGSGSEVVRRLDSVLYPGPSDPTSDDAGLTQPSHFNGVTMDYGSSGSISQTMGRVSTVVLRSDWPGTYTGTESQLKKNLISYSYVGVGTRAITDLPQINIQSDRTFGDTRTRSTSGTWSYAGWDRFGRLRLQSWVSGGTNASNAVPAWFQERFVHDLGGRRTHHYQDRTDSLFVDDDWQGKYDGLDRLTEGLRGVAGSGSSFYAEANSKAWTLDELGNFKSVGTGNDPNISPTSSEARTHNATNELTQIGSGSGQKNRCYDAAGNLVLVTTGTSSTPTLTEIMVYDAWNRLVKVSRPVPSTQIVSGSGDYLDAVSNRYNGLSWRTAEWRRSAQRSTGGGTAASLAMSRWFTYTGSWQVAQEHLWKPWGSSSSKQWVEQQYYGLRGTDDVVYRRVDGGSGTGGVSSSGDGVPDWCFGNDLPYITGYGTPGYGVDGGYYQLTDSQFSVIAHVDAGSGLLTRRYGYDSYGKLESNARTDVNGDGWAGDGNDDGDLWPAVLAGLPSADFNRDGVTNSTDWDDYDSAKSVTGPAASSPACGNMGWGDMAEPRIGYAGYVRAEWTYTVSPLTNVKLATTGAGANWWLARNRFFDPLAGRWINRDPAGYVDGLSMYLYVRGNPWGLVDPMGLRGDGDDPAWWERGLGGLQALGGLAEAVGGAAFGLFTAETGVGAVIGGMVTVHGFDNWQAGIQTAFGKRTSTITSQIITAGLEDAGMNPANARVTGSTIDGMLGFGGSTLTSEIRTIATLPKIAPIAEEAPAITKPAATGLVHLTDDVGKSGINATKSLDGTKGIFAVPKAVEAESALAKSARTGLDLSKTTNAIDIPEAALPFFKQPVPVGPYSAWKFFGGVRTAPPGSIDMATGLFKPSNGLIGPGSLIYGPDAIFWGASRGIPAAYNEFRYPDNIRDDRNKKPQQAPATQSPNP